MLFAVPDRTSMEEMTINGNKDGMITEAHVFIACIAAFSAMSEHAKSHTVHRTKISGSVCVLSVFDLCVILSSLS